jgi:tetratricopeptide (TPR) repeat protein
LAVPLLPPWQPPAGADAPALAAEMRLEGGGTGRAPMAVVGAVEAQTGGRRNHNDPQLPGFLQAPVDKGAYLRAGEDAHALAAVERLLLIHPEDADEVRDRGLLQFRLKRYAEAIASLLAYLDARPDAHDRERVEGHVQALREILSSLN